MLTLTAGEWAGKIWNSLNENGEMTIKDLKKVLKTRADKDIYLGIGWLLREDKIEATEKGAETSLKLK